MARARTNLTRIETRGTDLSATTAAAETAAAGGLVPAPDGIGFVKIREDTPRTPEQVAREQELRGLLYGQTRLRVKELYLDACQTGADEELVRAIERAPIAFPLINEETRQQIRAWRLNNSLFAERIEQLRRLASVYAMLHDAARKELAAMAIEVRKNA